MATFKQKVEKLTQELWDKERISDEELNKIDLILQGKKEFDINKRWNFL